jgi:hypothetical protein
LHRVNVTLYRYNEALHWDNEALDQYNESLHRVNVTLYWYNEALNRLGASALPPPQRTAGDTHRDQLRAVLPVSRPTGYHRSFLDLGRQGVSNAC